MKNLLLFLLIGGVMAWSSCATIIKGGKSQTVLDSTPTSKVTIYNADNQVVFTGNTPTVFKLKKGNGFFKAANYRVVFELDNYKTRSIRINSKSEPWVWGNLAFGGIIGLVIDGSTGAMFRLDKNKLNPTLKPADTQPISANGLNIMDIRDLSEAQIKQLVPLTQTTKNP